MIASSIFHIFRESSGFHEILPDRPRHLRQALPHHRRRRGRGKKGTEASRVRRPRERRGEGVDACPCRAAGEGRIDDIPGDYERGFSKALSSIGATDDRAVMTASSARAGRVVSANIVDDPVTVRLHLPALCRQGHLVHHRGHGGKKPGPGEEAAKELEEHAGPSTRRC